MDKLQEKQNKLNVNGQIINGTQNKQDINDELLKFLDESPNAFFAVKNMKEMLAGEGFRELFEWEPWEIKPGGSYFVTRNGSALIAFKMPEKEEFSGFQIMASHSDSPVFKIKPNAHISVEERFVKLNVEKYGGMLLSSWLDRPLSVAGRVIVETKEGIETRLVNIDRDLMIIPNLAIHMNREANDGYKLNAQKDMLPLFCDIDVPEDTGTYPAGGSKEDEKKKGYFLNMIADAAGVSPEQILDSDLYLYNRMRGTYLGPDREFIASGRLDDLQCAFASVKGLILAKPEQSVAVHCVFDNEETGSRTRQGAAGTFLSDTLKRITACCGISESTFLQKLASSFMVSADNAHAVHPNHKDKADPTSRPYLNRGIVIKYSADQKYTTDALSGAIFRAICSKADVPYQVFANRSDMIGGSTLGNISQSQISVNTVDIGLPQLAMHSAFETAGALDTDYLVRAAKVLFSGGVENRGDGKYKFII